jgi:hypothetical protein
MSGHITTVATTRGGQQPVVIGGCTVAASWHVTSALPVNVVFVKRVRLLPTTVALLCASDLPTREPSYAASFTLEARNPQRAAGHVAALEPSRKGRSDMEPRNTWQHRCPPRQGGGTRGIAGTLLSREAGSGATRHMAASEPSLSGRQGPKLRDTW